MNRTGQMTSKALTEIQLKQAHVVLIPKVGQYHWSEVNHINILINEAIREAKELPPDIKKSLKRTYLFEK